MRGARLDLAGRGGSATIPLRRSLVSTGRNVSQFADNITYLDQSSAKGFRLTVVALVKGNIFGPSWDR